MLTWSLQEKPLYHNLSKGIIISNMSLVLQRVGRVQSGIYTCVAHNSEGDGVSNPITLNVRYRPLCSPEQVMVYGVARLETVLVSCQVLSNPASGLRFHWVYNTSGETVQLEQAAVKVEGSRALVEYTPRTELDYGSLLCWGENSIGVQSQPCTFHIIPAGPPDSLSNCTVHNQTFTGLTVSCGSGFDGGLRQSFKLEVRDAVSGFPLLDLAHDKAFFQLTGLLPGHGYIITVTATNAKGVSEPVSLHAFTLKETSPEQIVADTSRQANLVVTPVLVILIAILAGLALVAVCIILVMRVKHSKALASSYHSTHIPLQKGLSSNQCLSEKDPDIIPSNKGTASTNPSSNRNKNKTKTFHGSLFLF